MTPTQIALVQQTFEQMKPFSDQAAALFYSRIFELDPALRQMFSGDMVTQGRMLMQAIELAVTNLEHPGEILDTVRALGRRHAGYGVQEAHFATIGEALLWTIDACLGGTPFTPEVEAAWAAAYDLLASAMIEALRQGQR